LREKKKKYKEVWKKTLRKKGALSEGGELRLFRAKKFRGEGSNTDR